MNKTLFKYLGNNESNSSRWREKQPMPVGALNLARERRSCAGERYALNVAARGIHERRKDGHRVKKRIVILPTIYTQRLLHNS